MELLQSGRQQGTQFTCFTGTKIQILTQSGRQQGTQFTCFTGTKVQILTQKALQVQRVGEERRKELTYAAVCYRMLTYADVC